MSDSLLGFDFNTCECKALVNPIPSLNSVTSPETGGIASWVAQSVSETVIVHKMLSHWNWLLHFGTCSIFPKGNGSEYNKIGCHEKNNVEPGKTKKNIKSRGQKTAEKGGKTAEKGGKTAEKDGL